MLKRPRIKDENHLDFIRSLSCCVCGDNTTTEAAHIRIGNRSYGKRETGMGEKPSDKWVLPLCGECHRKQHAYPEDYWWERKDIDPFTLSMSLYVNSGEHEVAEQILEMRRQ